MFFRDIAGQDIAVGKLRDAIDNNRLPHALLITGPEGTCGLALAWAAAQYILCQHKHDGEPCGECPECIQASKLGHPDLHWVYPLINKGGSGKEASVSEDFLSDWRTALMQNPNLNLQQWIRAQGSDENKQAHIFVSEAGSIIRTLSTKPYESDYRILILWLPEKLNEDAANKLLKIVEEPYEKTFFLMVSNNPEQIIGTIQSRVQRLQLAPIDFQGNFVQPGIQQPDEEDRLFFFEKFCAMMRLSYSRKLFEMKKWSEEMANLGRERQKGYLQYAQNLIRENYVMNLHQPELNYMKPDEETFSSRFSRFVNARNVEGIMHELEVAENDVTLNVSSKMIFFDLSLKLIMLLKAGNQG
ncbi:MAG: DNA polymerase III subunit delta [Bacteroidales bacterium]|nr:DNA polymerase III subunit delta [Bacteroidales bacterium]MBP5213920.1 DNA polymerase III subunit delta [Bacteroidales bacterium]